MLRTSVSASPSLISLVNELRVARWFWCAIVVGIVGGRYFFGGETPLLGPKFGDTDDALRLLQVRDFLVHGNWFDTHLSAIGAPQPLNSHWSRLIDLPLAWLVSFFALLLPYLTAETAAAIVWPLLLLYALARFMTAEAERRAGAYAGAVVLVLLVLCTTAVFQFMPGRIDHHNAQILFATLGLLLLQRAVTDARSGWYAGAAIAAGLAVGLEALPLLGLALAVACLIACFDHGARPGVARAAMALGAGIALSHLVTTHPALWLTADCDKIGANTVALCGAGATAAAILISRFRTASHLVWLSGFAIAGLVGVALYFVANPVCAGGAFAGMDAIVKTHWLDRVIESQSLLSYGSANPSVAIAYLATSLIVITVVVRTALATRTSSDHFIAASTILGTLYGFYYVKFMPYGSLLALVPLACWIARLPAIGNAPADSVRLRAIIACNQIVYVLVVSSVTALFPGQLPNGALAMSVDGCSWKADIGALRRLPPGLVVSDIDLGPFIALTTAHRAYAGPYHRIHTSISDVLRLQMASLDEAGRHLKRMNADYLVLCSPPGEAADVGAGEASEAGPDAPRQFHRHMRAGGTFPGLEPISIGKTEGPLKVWRIVRPR